MCEVDMGSISTDSRSVLGSSYFCFQKINFKNEMVTYKKIQGKHKNFE